jgi:beta-lactamase class A
MGQFGFSKKVLILVCVVVLGGYYVGYHSVHTIAVRRAHKAAVAKQQAEAAVKAQKAAALKGQLETSWQQALVAAPPDGNVDVAVYDSATGAMAHYTNTPPGTGFMTASVIKLSILETMLWQNQKNNISGLATSQLAEATPMIEDSDNDAASSLWTTIGGSKAVNSFFQQIGTTGSHGSTEHWGWSTTTAADQVNVIGQVAYPKLLSTASVAAANNLLDHVKPDQRWGVSGGVPSGVTVRLKNGWLDPGETNGNGWVVNSVGYVNGGGANYTIAVLTNGNKSETHGIKTIEILSDAAWKTIAAASPKG